MRERRGGRQLEVSPTSQGPRPTRAPDVSAQRARAMLLLTTATCCVNDACADAGPFFDEDDSNKVCAYAQAAIINSW